MPGGEWEVWQSERRSGQRTGDALKYPAGRMGGCRREGSSGVVSLLCVRKPRGGQSARCQCLEGALSYERTATGHRFVPRARAQRLEPDLRPHSARRRAPPRWPRERASAAAAAATSLASLIAPHRTSAHSSASTSTSTTTTTVAPTMATEAPLPVEAAAHDAPPPPQPEPAADTAHKPVKRSWR